MSREICTLDCLSIGDRFYKATDKQKKVWMVVSVQLKTVSAKKDGDVHATNISNQIQVVFLRNVNDGQ